ncbi:MAG: DUF255 domain-containing protein [Pseudomonadota bacterium]
MATQLPPGTNRDAQVHAHLEAVYLSKGSDYTPRTHLMDGDRARYVNRLIDEPSPYLLQHAHNPVDWRPWSEDALAEAARRDMPIFLSVGYATCHWCHVMEEESFDNEAVAEILNKNFIPVKIDREQHPELDHLYITATQLQNGHAGWPNSVFLMPDGRPFHTAGYMPRDHFMQIIAAIGQSWREPVRRPEIEALANNLSDAVRRLTQMRSGTSAALTEETYALAATQLEQMHNALEGGFSQTQQFPQEGYLLFLLDHWRRTDDDSALTMALETLDAIAAGGIHDHAGGGFHRYTVDPNWRTPHFEKMLYNQAQLARVFVQAWEITGAAHYRRAAERTFDYVARDMTDPDGAFYAAEDADSRASNGELEEGAFYVWTPEDLATHGLTDATNALGLDDAPTLDHGGVPHLDPFADTDFDRLDPMLDAMREARETRVRPLRDDKIIAGWNGLMIRTLAEASEAFGNRAYSQMAVQAADSLWRRFWDGEKLARFWADGAAHEQGALQDHVWVALGFLALGDATGAAVWTDRARLLTAAMTRDFADGTGRLKMAALDGPLGPIYDSTDGAVPSGESSALELLALSTRRSTDLALEESALDLKNALSAPLAEQPLLRPDALIAARILDDGESGRRQSLARGTVRAHLLSDRLDLIIADGWHVNAAQPGADWLIGASLQGTSAAWPEGKPFEAGFADAEIRVYDGRVSVPLDNAPSGKIILTLQVCSHEICLEPEEATFRLP